MPAGPVPDDLRGGHRAPRRFIDWQTFFDFGDGRARRNKLIDTKLSTVLFALLGQPAGEPTSLASRDLLRNLALGVPSGQRVAKAMELPTLAHGDLADLVRNTPACGQRQGDLQVTRLCRLHASIAEGRFALRMVGTRPTSRCVIGLLVVLALGVSACAGATSVAASVGDKQIAVADVEAAYASRAGSSDLASQLAGDQSGETERNLKAAVLTDLIRSEILGLAAQDRGIEVTDEEIAEQRTTVVESTGGEEALQQALERANVTEEELEGDLRDQVIARKIGEGLSDDVADAEVQAAFEADAQGQFGPRIKVRHILTEQEQEAQDAIERIQSGEDFAAVAQELSTDTGSATNGGDLGTVPKGATVAEFDEAAFGAKVGELVGPVQTQFGFHVIEVTEKLPAPEFAEVEGDIRSQLQSAARSQAFNTYISELVNRLGVEVDEQYGTWNAQSLSVVVEAASEPPAAPGSELPAQPAPASSTPPSE